MRENLYENEMIHKLKKLNAGMPSEAELWLALQCTPSSNSSIPSKKLEERTVIYESSLFEPILQCRHPFWLQCSQWQPCDVRAMNLYSSPLAGKLAN